ncbi:MAG TPA: gluconokinase [Anaerolineales bacterium]|nr:gluconokinase [Anaerolineales bacterium]
MIVIIMGVSGAGKTTIGQLLAKELGWTFYDADDLHSASNKDKMSHGIPLTDEDRAGWLASLRDRLKRTIEDHQSMVLACSALKQEYRNSLRVSEEVRFVYLRGSYRQIEARMKKRRTHYMKPGMLASQFAILEEPADALVIDIARNPVEIVALIRTEWKLAARAKMSG